MRWSKYIFGFTWTGSMSSWRDSCSRLSVCLPVPEPNFCSPDPRPTGRRTKQLVRKSLEVSNQWKKFCCLYRIKPFLLGIIKYNIPSLFVSKTAISCRFPSRVRPITACKTRTSDALSTSIQNTLDIYSNGRISHNQLKSQTVLDSSTFSTPAIKPRAAFNVC